MVILKFAAKIASELNRLLSRLTICVIDKIQSGLILLLRNIMKSVLKNSLSALTFAVLLFALMPYLIPCSFCHDECCNGAESCGSLSSQCFCGLIGTDTEKYVHATKLVAAGNMKLFVNQLSIDDIYREFYRPPELTTICS
jgi:hypothetical protein